MTKLELSNSSRWKQVWFQDGIPPTAEKFSRVTCPILLESPVLAIIFNLPLILDTWQFCGYLSREINTGLIIGGVSAARLGSSRKLFANKIQIFMFEELATYSLSFDSVIKGSCSLIVYEYTGEIT